MDTEQLRAMQAPLKQKYREQPDAAQITLKAQGRIGEGITCKVDTGRAMVEAGSVAEAIAPKTIDAHPFLHRPARDDRRAPRLPCDGPAP